MTIPCGGSRARRYHGRNRGRSSGRVRADYHARCCWRWRVGCRFDVPQWIWQDCRDDAGICEPLLSKRAGVGPFEEALLADGVAMDKLYAMDVDRALKSPDKIRPSLTTWWKEGAE